LSKLTFILLSWLLFPVSLLAGDGRDTLIIFKSNSAIIFDGKCNEDAWNQVTPLQLMMYTPDHGNAPSEKSEVFVTYDENYFYLAGRLYYTNGAKIQATSKKRDAFDRGNDYLGVLFDTFNDNENGLCFETNPEGLRQDYSVANDALPIMDGPPMNQAWNTYWDVKTSVENNTWQVEMRIPFSSLRFQDDNGKVKMGMTVWRYIASKQETDLYPRISDKFGRFGMMKPSQSSKILLMGVKRKNPVYITPYVLGGFEQTSELNSDGSAYELKNNPKLTAGLDLKYSLTSNLTLDLTANTDFAQVESDDQMVNLNRFDIFYPEKRQFFLERSSILEFNSGFNNMLFYSRRIGLHNGTIVPIYGGMRVIGRAGKWDVGALDMQTAGINYSDPDTAYRVNSTNYGVFRLRKQVINPRSYAGGIVTSKVDINGNYNVNAGLDAIINLFGNDYLSMNYAQTIDNHQPAEVNPWNNSKLYLNWDRRTQVGFGYSFYLSHAGKYYDPQMGFEIASDYSSGFGEIGYGWASADESKRILRHRLFLLNWVQKRNNGFGTDFWWAIPGWSVDTKKGYGATILFMNRYEDPVDTFKLSDDAYFSPGTYKFRNLNAFFNTPQNKLISVMMGFTAGSYYDGYILSLGSGSMTPGGPSMITARLSSSLKLGLDYQYNRVNIPARNQNFQSHLARLKTEFTFTTKWSLLMYIQYSSNDNFGIDNVRLRYNPKEGNDLYLVYNDGYNTSLDREIPSLPPVSARSILVKYTYTFIFNK
jgi:hypothetical protein